MHSSIVIWDITTVPEKTLYDTLGSNIHYYIYINRFNFQKDKKLIKYLMKLHEKGCKLSLMFPGSLITELVNNHSELRFNKKLLSLFEYCIIDSDNTPNFKFEKDYVRFMAQFNIPLLVKGFAHYNLLKAYQIDAFIYNQKLINMIMFNVKPYQYE